MRFLKVILIVWVIAMILWLGLGYLGMADQGVERKIDARSLAEAQSLHAAESTPTPMPPVWKDSLIVIEPDTAGVEIDTSRLDSSIIYEAWPSTGGIFVSTGDSLQVVLRGGTIIGGVKQFKNIDTLVMNTAGTFIWEHNGLGACTHFDYKLEHAGGVKDSLGDTTFVYGTVVRDRH